MAKAGTQNAKGKIWRQSASMFGPNSKHTTWKLTRMNLAICGIDANLGPKIPVCLWFLAKNRNAETENNTLLFGGETEQCLVG